MSKTTPLRRARRVRSDMNDAIDLGRKEDVMEEALWRGRCMLLKENFNGWMAIGQFVGGYFERKSQ